VLAATSQTALPPIQTPQFDYAIARNIAVDYDVCVITSAAVTKQDERPNLPVAAFPANRLLASATVDRLCHNAYCLGLDGPSYHNPRQSPASARRRLANEPETVHS